MTGTVPAHNTWPVVDRRAMTEQQTMLMLIQQTHDSVTAMDGRLTQHMLNETQELAAAMVKATNAAFPAGDPDGHRRHHEAVIAKAEARAKFWQTMVIELSKWGLIGLAGWAVIALWQSFLAGPHK
jgi:hypothetical protein